jgi:hypothetical protein
MIGFVFPMMWKETHQIPKHFNQLKNVLESVKKYNIKLNSNSTNSKDA